MRCAPVGSGSGQYRRTSRRSGRVAAEIPDARVMGGIPDTRTGRFTGHRESRARTRVETRGHVQAAAPHRSTTHRPPSTATATGPAPDASRWAISPDRRATGSRRDRLGDRRRHADFRNGNRARGPAVPACSCCGVCPSPRSQAKRTPLGTGTIAAPGPRSPAPTPTRRPFGQRLSPINEMMAQRTLETMNLALDTWLATRPELTNCVPLQPFDNASHSINPNCDFSAYFATWSRKIRTRSVFRRSKCVRIHRSVANDGISLPTRINCSSFSPR